MTSPLVNPTSGYSTLSRFESLTSWPSMVTTVGFDSGTRWVYPSGRLALPRCRLLRGTCRLRSSGLAVSRLLVGGPSCRVALAGLLGGSDARLQRSHEVDDLVGGDRLRCGHELRLARSLALDEVEHAVAIRVLVLLRFERARQRVDELLRHRHLAIADVDAVDAAELGDRVGVVDLVGVHHRRQQQLTVLRAHRGEVLLRAHHEAGGAHLRGRRHGLRQPRVRLYRGVVAREDAPGE